ncbi:hypothetical protein GCM10023310_39200 [Paenibacillus vulneris]|uniref:Uncharacterized protein n=1 Tax=Paenibacillus vulneris TaxID=1133364 RepID=A0ABW3UMV1_9BACL
MEWFYQDILIDTPVTERNIEEMDISRISLMESVDRISYIAQYYCLSALFTGNRTLIQIPVYSNEHYHIIMNEIASNFKDIRIVSYSKKVTEVNLMSIKESTTEIIKKLIVDRNINQIAYDMYGSNITTDSSPREPHKLNWFSTHIHMISKLEMDENQSKLAKFLQESHLVNGDSFGVYVNGWAFNDSLKDRLAFRFLCSFCREIQFAVDKDNNVIELRCF